MFNLLESLTSELSSILNNGYGLGRESNNAWLEQPVREPLHLDWARFYRISFIVLAFPTTVDA